MQVIEEVLSRIVPTPEEEAKLREVEKELVARIRYEASQYDRRLYARLLGSASRGTWLRYQKDLDIFIFFPEEYSKEEMERIVTSIASRVLKGVEKRYAEHPYVRGEFRGYDVELVPCYAIKDTSYLKSAVDRTPFHNDYVKKRISSKENEVRLLKQFLKGIACYGAEAKVEGFSGYLCELLVIKFGSFIRVLEAAKHFKRGEVLSLRGDVDEKAVRRKFSSPLIFLDPVDENRNVAAA
ncbi:MAG TPA: CCA tRNA nucleotidyltransferase, partial [Planctomycetaceae bacterium]|nr:CCA tRNA nucleotidyltransferase [Planctomycetaceae bacterium]